MGPHRIGRSVGGRAAFFVGKGVLKFHLHGMHENRCLMTDLIFLDALRPESLSKLCHFGTPEKICFLAVKTLECVGASPYIGGPPVGGELQQGHAISILLGPNRPDMNAPSSLDLHKQ